MIDKSKFKIFLKPWILKLIGILIFIIVLLFSLPVAIPKLMGYQVYSVESDSMSPTINKGSIIYVKQVPVEEIVEDDVISFYEGSNKDDIVTHRVVSINDDEGYFITKGDKNDSNDKNPVYFSNYLGKLTYDIPAGDFILVFFNSILGKIILIVLLLLSLALWIIADRLSGSGRRDKSHGKKVGRSGIVSWILILIGIVLIIYSLVNIIGIYKDYSSSNELYSQLEDKYVKENDDSSQEEEDEVLWYNMMTVDFDGLKEQNSDVCGWIYFENEDISYPIMYSGDDDYYLRRTLDKSEATAGSIFLEGDNNPDFSDLHSIVYGHNMKNLSMFGKLKYYNWDEEYYDSHQYFQIILPDKKLRFQIYSYETVSEDSSIYTVGFGQDDNFQKFINHTVSYSLRDTGIVPQISDRIVTLSTCSTSGDTYRFVVHGVLVAEN